MITKGFVVTILIVVGSKLGAVAPLRDIESSYALDGVKLSLQMKQINLPRSPIVVRVEFRNTSGEAITFRRTTPLVFVEVRDRKGALVSLTDVGSLEALPAPDPKEAHLAPDEALTFECDLRRWFDPPLGWHTVTLRRGFHEHDSSGARLLKLHAEFFVGNPEDMSRQMD